MKSKFVAAALRYGGVAVTFAICGAGSSILLLAPDRDGFLYAIIPKLLPVPFALLCTLLFLRMWRALFAIPLIAAVWFVAKFTAVSLAVRLGTVGDREAVCVGGLIGGLGLVLCVSTCYGRLLSPKYLFCGAVIGCFSALSFAPWLRTTYPNSDGPDPLFLLAFAIWQAAVGTYLYAICTAANQEAQPEGSQGANAG